MRSKFFTLAISTLLASATPLFAQAQTPAPKVGYIRFWDMLPPQNGTFEVRKVSGPGAEEGLANATGYRYSSYREVNIGRYRLGVFKAGTNAPLKLFDVDLKPNSFFTILISPQSIEMLDDTNDPKATSGTLIIRNYFNGVSVSIASNARPLVNALAYGQTQVATGFPLSRVPLNIRTRLPNGTPVESGAEADLTYSKRATVLLIPDSYGRFCARIAIDGTNQ